jgi:DNA-binding MarR family transcriptional regulator
MVLNKQATMNEIVDALPGIMQRLRQGHRLTDGKMALTIDQVRTLHIIGSETDCHMGELARQLGISLSAATGLVDRLVQRGLVKRATGDSDRRVVCLRLAATGRRARQVFRKKMRRRMQAALRRLSAQELKQIASSINLLRSAIEATQARRRPNA